MRRSKADAEITRCRILEAAADQFAKQGINRTRLSDIATAAGVTRGAIYWHFCDKEALITAMIDSVSAPTEAAMMALNSTDNEELSLETLKKVVVDAFTRVYDIPASAQITRFILRYALSEEAESLKTRINNDRNIAVSRISQFIDNAQQAGLVKPELSAACIANHIRAHIIGLFHHHLSIPAPGLKPQDVAASMDLLLSGLRN
ncbi:TetR family transcriptional regulator [Zhongshania guokunii]|uniref:TetR family transcriptional regulator n=1 Tax=Zhongshania guokunii TaxID=641783 RepID=A0ABV3U5M5_9GAMM